MKENYSVGNQELTDLSTFSFGKVSSEDFFTFLYHYRPTLPVGTSAGY